MFDSHAHYFDKKFDTLPGGAAGVLSDPAFTRAVSGVLNLGTDPENSLACIAQAAEYPFMYAAVGIHPEDCLHLADCPDAEIAKIEALVRDPVQRRNNKIVAIGEIGLDYYWGADRKKKQQDYFEAQMQLARELNLPVSLHDRDAHGDLFEIVLRYPEVRGVVHAFSGSEEMARELWRRGWYIGFGGVVTFKNAERVRRVAASVPLEFLLTETDCPYMAPVPHRGEINNSSYMCESVNMMASLHGVTPAEMEEVTERNARTLFEI